MGASKGRVQRGTYWGFLPVERPVACTTAPSADATTHLLLQFFLDTKLNVLLVALPFAIISEYADWGDAATFTLSMVALTPLAEVRCDVGYYRLKGGDIMYITPSSSCHMPVRAFRGLATSLSSLPCTPTTRWVAC